MKKIAVVTVSVAIVLVVMNILVLQCNVSDEEAIQLSEKFFTKMNISIDSKPWVLSTRNNYFMFGGRVKEIAVGSRDAFKVSVDVDCKNREINSYNNQGLRDQVFSKYKISPDNRQPRNWPPLLTESKAKEKIFNYANTLGLPQDVEFYNIGLDKQYNGTWVANWKRTFNGFSFEDDFLSISIMAIEGEFFSYSKHFTGIPCPTVVKISKEKAIETARNKISTMLTDDKAKKHLLDYVVTSSELKIVQPNAIAGFITPFYRKKSELAWVVVFQIYNDSLKRVEEVNFAERFVIKIGAATGKVIGGKVGG